MQERRGCAHRSRSTAMSEPPFAFLMSSLIAFTSSASCIVFNLDAWLGGALLLASVAHASSIVFVSTGSMAVAGITGSTTSDAHPFGVLRSRLPRLLALGDLFIIVDAPCPRFVRKPQPSRSTRYVLSPILDFAMRTVEHVCVTLSGFRAKPFVVVRCAESRRRPSLCLQLFLQSDPRSKRLQVGGKEKKAERTGKNRNQKTTRNPSRPDATPMDAHLRSCAAAHLSI